MKDMPIQLAKIFAVLLIGVLIGCANNLGPVVSNNAVSASVPPPRIETVNKKSTIEVGEAVTGYGCRESVLGLFKSGDRHFLPIGNGSLTTDLDYAKAAAAYDALFGMLKDHPPVYHDKSKPFPNDILLTPVFHFEEKGDFFSKQICVTVTGFRGVIKKIEDSDSTTEWTAPVVRIMKIVN